MRTLIFAASFAFAATLPAVAQTPMPPAGKKVVSGRHFDLYVSKTEEKPLVPGLTLNIFQVVAVAKTQTHGTQRITRRVEAYNADLLDAASWEIVDFDKDGLDDYRYLMKVDGKTGCRTWDAERWDPAHDRFTMARDFFRWTDAQKKEQPTNCIKQ